MNCAFPTSFVQTLQYSTYSQGWPQPMCFMKHTEWGQVKDSRIGLLLSCDEFLVLASYNTIKVSSQRMQRGLYWPEFPLGSLISTVTTYWSGRPFELILWRQNRQEGLLAFQLCMTLLYQRLVQNTCFCVINFPRISHHSAPSCQWGRFWWAFLWRRFRQTGTWVYSVSTPAETLEGADHLLHVNTRLKCGLFVVEAQKKMLMHSKLRPISLSLACNKIMQAKNRS